MKKATMLVLFCYSMATATAIDGEWVLENYFMQLVSDGQNPRASMSYEVEPHKVCQMEMRFVSKCNRGVAA